MKKFIIVLIAAFFSLNNLFSQEGGKVVALSKKDFIVKIYDFDKSPDEWSYKGKVPCIIDFYADWCIPCKKMTAYFDELAEEYKGKIIIYRIDIDSERDLSKKMGVSSIPTAMFIPMKGDPQLTRGELTKEDIDNAIREVLLKQ